MYNTQALSEKIQQQLGNKISQSVIALDELTLTVPAQYLREGCLSLKESPFQFDTLIDVCGVDYLHYGISDWETTSTTETGFSRAVTSGEKEPTTFFEARVLQRYNICFLLPRISAFVCVLSVSLKI